MPPETVTISQIKDLIKEEKIQPSTLFGRDQLIDDPFVKGYVEEERKTAGAGEYAHRKRTDEKFDEERKRWEDEKKVLTDQVGTMKKEGAKIKAGDLFKTKIKERKFNEKETAFIKTEIPFFEVEDVEKLEKEVDEFLDNTHKDYKEKAKIFGETESEPEPTGGGEPSDGGSGNADHIPD